MDANGLAALPLPHPPPSGHSHSPSPLRADCLLASLSKRSVYCVFFFIFISSLLSIARTFPSLSLSLRLRSLHLHSLSLSLSLAVDVTAMHFPRIKANRLNLL